MDVIMEEEDSDDQTEDIPDSTQDLSVGIFTREGTVVGTDMISKMILTINMVIKVLVPEMAEDHYVATPTELINKNKCNVLYDRQDPLSTFPPVLTEVQNQVDEKLLVRAVHYCTLIYERYKKHPILVIIGVASVTAQSMNMTAPNSDLLFAVNNTRKRKSTRKLMLRVLLLGTVCDITLQLHIVQSLYQT
jgi:hypothetical protein